MAALAGYVVGESIDCHLKGFKGHHCPGDRDEADYASARFFHFCCPLTGEMSHYCSLDGQQCIKIRLSRVNFLSRMAVVNH